MAISRTQLIFEKSVSMHRINSAQHRAQVSNGIFQVRVPIEREDGCFMKVSVELENAHFSGKS